MIFQREHRASVTQNKKVRITYPDYDNKTTKTIGDRSHCAGMTEDVTSTKRHHLLEPRQA